MTERAASHAGLLDAVRGVHWPARRVIHHHAHGSHPSTVQGTSAEFTDYRRYRQGDDPRRVDWRLLARSDRAYLRLATDRAVLPTAILLDTSASMAFPVATHAKWERAQEIAIGLAAIAHADGDPVGVALTDDMGERRVVRPQTRRGIVEEIVRVVSDADPDGSAPLTPLLADLRARRIAIITDLLGDGDELLRAARVRLVGGGEVHVVHVIAREELEPPSRPVLASDPEEPGIQRLLMDATRSGYERSFAAWREETARRWFAAGASYVQVLTDEGAAHAVRRIAELPAGAHFR